MPLQLDSSSTSDFQFDIRLLSEVRRLELRSKRRVSADLMGRYRSAFRGSGLSFSDLRAYEPGDDVKHIHWKVTARTGKPFVKTYDEDRQLRLFLLVDSSASTGVGGGRSKHVRSVEFAALVSMLAFKSRDKLGLCLFAREIDHYLPPSATRYHFTRVLVELSRTRELGGGTDLRGAIQHFMKNESRPCIVFLLTDFVAPNYEEELHRLAIKHDVIAVTVRDPIEYSPPPLGIVHYRDAETGKTCFLDLASTSSRQAFRAAVADRDRRLRDILQRSGADLIHIEDNPLLPLSQLMNQRIARVR